METMYKGIPFSPTATLTANISSTDTVIPVSDVNAFPDGPSMATIGTDTDSETIIYGSKTSDSLSGCVRGVEGTAKEWSLDDIIGRNFTAKDHEDMIKNIEELNSKKLDATYKVTVVNNSTTTSTGNALDATQNNPDIDNTLAYKAKNALARISVLEDIVKSKFVDLANKSLIEYAKSLNVGKKVTIQFQGATDTPTSKWYYAEITTHIYDTNHINILLFSLQDTTEAYVGNVITGNFGGWNLITEKVGNVSFLNNWAQFQGHQTCKVTRIGNRCFLSGLATKGLTDIGTDVLNVPKDFRPSEMHVITHANFGFYMKTDGTLTLNWVKYQDAEAWYSLDGLSWEVL